MIVDRRTFIAKPGKGGKMKEMLIELFEKNPWPGGNLRIYTSHIGPFNHVIVESESESLAAFEQAQAQFEQGFPKADIDMDVRHEIEVSASTQMWKLAYERRIED